MYKQCKHFHIFLIFLLGLVGETPFINSPTAHLFIPPLMQSAQISKQTFKYQSQKSWTAIFMEQWMNAISNQKDVLVHTWLTLWYLSSYQLAPNEGAPKSGECFTGHWEVNEAKNGCQSLLHWWIIQGIRKRRYSNKMYCYKKSQDGSSSKMWYILSKVHKSWELLSVKACIAKLLLKLLPLLKICLYRGFLYKLDVKSNVSCVMVIFLFCGHS